ncbi:MAG: hypothetical protein AAGJ50_06865, partial [Pseudomonadota bacterium]
ARLIGTYGTKPKPVSRSHAYCGALGGVVLHAETGAKGLTVKLVPGASRENLEHAFARLLDDHAVDGVLPIGKK